MATQKTHEITIQLTVNIPIKFTYEPAEPAITHLAPEDCHPGSPEEIEWWISEEFNLDDILYDEESEKDVIRQISEYVKDKKDEYEMDRAEFLMDNKR